MAEATLHPVNIVVVSRRSRSALLARTASAALVVASLAVGISVPLLMTGVFGISLSQGTGISMEPTFHEGDIIISRSVAPGSLKPGDLVRFQQGEKQVIHRVVSTRVDAEGGVTLITRGDNNQRNDPPVPGSAVVGKPVLQLSWLRGLPFTFDARGMLATQWAASAGLLTLSMLLRHFVIPPGAASAGTRQYA